MTTKARRKKQTARKQHKLEELDNIISLDEHDYSELKQGVKITPRFPYKFTANQKKFIDLSMQDDVKIIFVSGLAGTAKTILATYCGLKLMQENRAESITYVRSIVESSKYSLGFLKGDMLEKISPYMRPLEEKLFEILPPNQIKELQSSDRIEAMPVNFLRGLDFRPQEENKKKIIILDEAQNCDYSNFELFLSRIGENCKIFVCGDPTQSDIRSGAFGKIYTMFDDEESQQNGIFTFKFTSDDIVRSKLVKYILSKFNL